MFAQYKMIILVAAAALLFGTGSTLAYKYQGSKVKAAEAERDTAMQANKIEHETVVALEDSLQKTHGACSDRLKKKDELLKGMMAIRELKPSEVVTNGTSTQIHSGDPVLDALNGVWLAHSDGVRR